MTDSPTCRAPGCYSTDLIKAHILPRGIARYIRDDADNLVVSDSGVQPAYPPLGYFDTGILCGPHDTHLGGFEDYGIEVCQQFHARAVRVGDHMEFRGFDSDKFLKFVLAVLWKASISKRPQFSEVNLGRYESLAAPVLFEGRGLDTLSEFEIVVERFFSDHFDTSKCVSLPKRGRFGAMNHYGFMLAGFRVVAKFDRRRFWPEAAPFVLNGNTTLRAPLRRIEETAEFDFLADAIAVQQKKGGVGRR